MALVCCGPGGRPDPQGFGHQRRRMPNVDASTMELMTVTMMAGKHTARYASAR